MIDLNSRIEEVKEYVKLWNENRFVYTNVHKVVSGMLGVDKKDFKDYCNASPELQAFINSFFDRSEDERRDAECLVKTIAMIDEAIINGTKFHACDITKATGISRANLKEFSKQNPKLWKMVYKGLAQVSKSPEKLKVVTNELLIQVKAYLEAFEGGCPLPYELVASELGVRRRLAHKAITSDPYLHDLYKLRTSISKKKIQKGLPPEINYEEIASQIVEYLANLTGPSGSLSFKKIADALGLTRRTVVHTAKLFPLVNEKLLERTGNRRKLASPSRIEYSEEEVDLVRGYIQQRSKFLSQIQIAQLVNHLKWNKEHVDGIFEAHPELNALLDEANEQIEKNQTIDFGSYARCELKYYKGRLTKRISLCLSKKELLAIGCEESILYFTDKNKSIGIYAPPTPDIGLYPIEYDEISCMFTFSWNPTICKEPTVGKAVPIKLHNLTTEHRKGLWFTFPEDFFLDRFK